jgi:16S rRNA G527 N7-methylase RsmG
VTTTVENCRAEELPAGFHRSADLVSIRAVRPDRALLQTIAGLLRPSGRVFCFGGDTILDDDLQVVGLEPALTLPLLRDASRLLVLRRS